MDEFGPLNLLPCKGKARRPANTRGESGPPLTDFEQRYNATAQPFRWMFTRDDLNDLLARLSQHEQHEVTAQLPPAA